jgi:hypothetical protein
MPSLVTRFHLLLFLVTLAIAGVVVLHVPANYSFPAHWHGSSADWLWPRDIAMAVAPAVQLALMGAFFVLGRALTKNHLAKTRHILDPALTLLMSLAAAFQLGLLLLGIGSDFDMFRIATGCLAATLLVLAVVIFEAERHSYGGLRMPWPIPSDRAWTVVHRLSGIATGLAAVLLGWQVWRDPGPGPLVVSVVATILALPLLAYALTLLTRPLR